MKLERKSYVYKVAEYGGLQNSFNVWKNNRTNVCALFWYVLWGLLRAPVIALTVGAGVSAMIIIFLGLPLFELWARFWLNLPWGNETKVLLSIIGIAWAVTLYNVFAALSGKRVVEKTLGSVADVIGSRWYDFKHKTCTIVEIE